MCISEILIQKNIVGLQSDFPFVAAVNGGKRAFEISFAKPIVLKNLYRGRIRVGIEIICIVAHHHAKIGHHVG